MIGLEKLYECYLVRGCKRFTVGPFAHAKLNALTGGVKYRRPRSDRKLEGHIAAIGYEEAIRPQRVGCTRLRIPTIVTAHTDERDRCSVRASVVFRV